MKTVALASALIVSCSFLPVAAEAAVYTSKYPPTGPQDEINGSANGLLFNARSMIAAARMGGKFYNNANVTVANQEETLLNKCTTSSPLGTAWPEGCNFGGLVTMMNAQPDFGKSWLELVFSVTSQSQETQQRAAISLQIYGLKLYKSPSILPIYGQVDHWVTLHQIETNPDDSVKYVRFMDACASYDYQGNSCLDNAISQATIAVWRFTYYMVIEGPEQFINSSDKYFNSYLMSYDPPPWVRADTPVSPLPPVDLNAAPMPGVVREGEVMAEWIAEERLWESLFLAEIDQDEMIWSVLSRGAPGPAWKVKAVAPSGAPWDYYLVPILDEGGRAVATIRLSAEDGAFEQLWLPGNPRVFSGTSPEAAAKIAGEMIADGEELRGGELEWSARVYNPYARSPNEPYYAFHVVDSATGADHGTITVRLSDGYGAGLTQSRARPQ